jgi:hypothetical protein
MQILQIASSFSVFQKSVCATFQAEAKTNAVGPEADLRFESLALHQA